MRILTPLFRTRADVFSQILCFIMTECLRLSCLGRLVTTSFLVLFTASDLAAQTTGSGTSEKAGTGSGTHSGYPVIQLPPDVDPEDENWKGIDLSPKAAGAA